MQDDWLNCETAARPEQVIWASRLLGGRRPQRICGDGDDACSPLQATIEGKRRGCLESFRVLDSVLAYLVLVI